MLDAERVFWIHRWHYYVKISGSTKQMHKCLHKWRGGCALWGFESALYSIHDNRFSILVGIILLWLLGYRVSGFSSFRGNITLYAYGVWHMYHWQKRCFRRLTVAGRGSKLRTFKNIASSSVLSLWLKEFKTFCVLKVFLENYHSLRIRRVIL